MKLYTTGTKIVIGIKQTLLLEAQTTFLCKQQVCFYVKLTKHSLRDSNDNIVKATK